ncbi:MAG: myo-inosose-2 dehydratase [Sphingomonas adhaesiva]|uniref:myo-inosose-2 dehydratase n=1 Tax=Sphingomonas adhaesiva TaxID=28212 RepID=UPI002FF7A81A
MSVRFGVSPIAWINDDMPHLGGDTPLEKLLGDASEIGFSGVELGGKFPRDPAILSPLLRSYGLDLVGGWFSGELLTLSPDAQIEAMQEHLALLEAMGCGVFVFAECSNTIHSTRGVPLSTRPVLDDAGWARFGRGITAVADYVAARGLRFAYHHHIGTVVETQADVDRFIAETGANAGLTVDTGHGYYGGLDVPALIRDHPGRVSHVHCKDVRADVMATTRQRDRSFLDGVLDGMFTVPGDGAIDFAPVFAALTDIGYAGWVIVEAEQDPARADPRRYGQIGLDHLRATADAATLEVAR